MSKWRQLRLLFRAHLLGDLDALHDIAAYFASEACEGRLGHNYLVRAFRYYKSGAIKNHRDCQYDYGFMLIEGEVGVQNKVEGLSWIMKAAKAGNISAKNFMADYPIETLVDDPNQE